MSWNFYIKCIYVLIIPSSYRKILYVLLENLMRLEYSEICILNGTEDDWDFRISDLVKNPDWTDI